MLVTEFSNLLAARRSLVLPARDMQTLFERLGPSLGLWRAAEVAVLREQNYTHPVLDVGCGDGIVTSRVLSNVDFGVDPDRSALAKAAKLGIYRQLIPSAVQDAQLPASCMRTVVSNSVLEHLPQVDVALSSIARLLRPGGKFVFTTPTETFASWLALPIAPYTAWRNRHLGHLNLWSLQCWAEHLERTGFEILETRCYLRQQFVFLWDVLELAQMLSLGCKKLVAGLWKRLSTDWLYQLAQRASTLDLGAGAEGGGRLIVARKL